MVSYRLLGVEVEVASTSRDERRVRDGRHVHIDFGQNLEVVGEILIGACGDCIDEIGKCFFSGIRGVFDEVRSPQSTSANDKRIDVMHATPSVVDIHDLILLVNAEHVRIHDERPQMVGFKAAFRIDLVPPKRVDQR